LWETSIGAMDTLKKIFGNILISCMVIITCLNGPVCAELVTIDKILIKVQEVYNETKDFTASFTQNATIKSMNKTVTEEGTLYLKKPMRMFWDYKKPALKKLVLNPQKAWLYMPDEKTVYIQDATSLLSSKMTMRFFTGIGKLKDDFDAALSTPDAVDRKGMYRVSLIPKRYESGIKQIILSIDKNNYHITGCTFTDMYENTTELIFKDMIINNNLPDTMFTFTPPPNVEVYHIP
jgi:outer membrane lipoprotein carrier protein